MTASDPFASIPNAGDSLNGEFSPVSRQREFDIIERTNQAACYLREAHQAGLPLPAYVTVSARDFGDFRASQIGIQLSSAREVWDWAVHFGTEVVTDKVGRSSLIKIAQHHDVQIYHVHEVPGLAEHTQAAPEEPWLNAVDVAGEPYHRPVPGLDAHTQAACDTITKAAQ